MNEEEKASTYDPDSEQSIIGDSFSKETLDEIKKHIPEAAHAEGLNPGYDIIIPLEEYNYTKIECKVCGTLRNGDYKMYTKIPQALFNNTESKYVRLKYKNYQDDYSTYYFKMSSFRKYYEKMSSVKTINEKGRITILWPTHLLDGMYTKIKTTEDLIESLNKDKQFKEQNSVENNGKT